ncbi:MAG: asparagine synthase (glutamine-hydrolyzing) [Desulfofustis sp. PB-SRB1]|nr:asparagine synthase (glutamine-hydrolyzing) [Desulfofustis sp. PB-SRB1]MBM1001652.1 asparagine synthase (glutamine-hydrolyzing) [Desulfofustis sp. PB-SRB1]
MCGIAGIFGASHADEQLNRMVAVQRHRGPDAEGVCWDQSGGAWMGHCRLSILDLSAKANQPMYDNSGRYCLVYNGEIYNYLEIREQLEHRYRFRTATDSEVLLAAYIEWGADCLDRFLGMFAFMIWDTKDKVLFAARDRFGVKPFYYSCTDGGVLFCASEIKALHAAGIDKTFDPVSWSTYFVYGAYDHTEKTFWRNVFKLPAGCLLTWRDNTLQISRWYDFRERVGRLTENRSIAEVAEEYCSLLEASVKLRFRSDVTVGVSLSGGLDSSVLLSLIRRFHGDSANINVFTFFTGDERYDELPWVRAMLMGTNYPLTPCLLNAHDIPVQAERVSRNQGEPFGGFPTLAYAHLFSMARKHGVTVLLDGQGMDEQLAGYDYYHSAAAQSGDITPVQGTTLPLNLAHCLEEDFKHVARPIEKEDFFSEELKNLQYRDIFAAKIPRALRFNDHASMMSSCELREPFLCHRLVELAFCQPDARKIKDGQGKWLLREIARDMMPQSVSTAPKRPVQTPQREWLQNDLADWATACIATAMRGWGRAWFKEKEVWRTWDLFRREGGDNSFPYWQLISLGLMQS